MKLILVYFADLFNLYIYLKCTSKDMSGLISSLPYFSTLSVKLWLNKPVNTFT